MNRRTFGRTASSVAAALLLATAVGAGPSLLVEGVVLLAFVAFLLSRRANVLARESAVKKINYPKSDT